MPFFKTEPNLPDNEKARIELQLQQVAESVGFDRMKLGVISPDSLLEFSESAPEQLVSFVGQHLGYDTSDLRVKVVPEQPEKCGGGG